LYPQVGLDDKKFFPIYAKCIEVDVTFGSTVGIPGPRIPFAPQQVEMLDEICWFFPELRFVTRHGCEPWTALAVKLMLKWPNLYYSTTAFAPKHYPKDIVNYANTRGTDKVMFSGYFPAGLTYDRQFSELPDVAFRDHVWPKFLRENAQRAFKLPST
jgi:predicted TIM-barrel fold metal-dependent hydrolase